MGNWEAEEAELDYWRLCDELTIKEAALLLGGVSPAQHSEVERWDTHQRPSGYEAGKTAIRNALRRKLIQGSIVPEEGTDFDGNPYSIEGSISLESRVLVSSLVDWLRARGLRTGFYFPAQGEDTDYLDSNHARYAPKLAAAVRAWQAVSDPSGRHPKQALTKWLREHAAEFGLSDDEGKPNEKGIEEIAKVANWQPTGGAPKTPSPSG